MSQEQERATYARGELKKLGRSDKYRLKITSDDGETHWLSITPAKLAEVEAVLTREAGTPAGRSEAGAEPAG